MLKEASPVCAFITVTAQMDRRADAGGNGGKKEQRGARAKSVRWKYLLWEKQRRGERNMATRGKRG